MEGNKDDRNIRGSHYGNEPEDPFDNLVVDHKNPFEP